MNKLIRSSAFLLFLFAGCSPIAAPTPTLMSVEPLATRTPLGAVAQVTLIADLVPSQTYESIELGLAFDYPESWTMTDIANIPGAAITIHSWDPAELSGDRPQSEGIPLGGEKIDIIPLDNFGLDYETALPWFRQQNANTSFTEQDVVLPSGAPGTLFLFEQPAGEVGTRCLLTEVSGNAILACGLAQEFHFFEPIVFSLRPLLP